MHPATVIFLALMGGLPFLIFWLNARQKRRNREILATITSLLDDPAADSDKLQVVGRRHGVEVSFHLTVRGAGKHRQAWTEVHLPPPPKGVSIELRPETGAERHMVQRGLAVDVKVGEAAFDSAYVLEVAPADVARALFDAELRTALMAAHPASILTTKDGLFRVERSGWDPAWAAAALDAGALLSARLPTAVAEAERALDALDRPVGSPYRPAIDAEAGRAARIERARENVELEAVKLARAAYVRKQSIIIGIVFVVVIAGVFMLRAMR